MNAYSWSLCKDFGHVGMLQRFAGLIRVSVSSICAYQDVSVFFVPPSRWAYNQTLRYAGLLHWGGHETDWEPGGSWATSTTFLIKTGAGCISCMRYGLLLIPSGLWLISSGLGWFTANKSTVEDQKCLRKKQEGHKTRLHKRRKISNSHRKVEHGISMNFLRFIHFATLLHSGNQHNNDIMEIWGVLHTCPLFFLLEKGAPFPLVEAVTRFCCRAAGKDVGSWARGNPTKCTLD